MRSATLVTTLTSLTTAMAVAAPIVVFGFLYVLLVQPERARAAIDRIELDRTLADLDRQRSSARAPSGGAESVVDEFAASAARVERPGDLVDVLTKVLNGPAVGGVSNLLIETGADGAGGTPVTLTFDARFEQVVRFVRSLRALPENIDLRTVEIGAASSRTGLARANASLLVSASPGQVVAAPVPPAAVAVSKPAREEVRIRRPAPAPPPAPVVSSILIADGRRLARVDGRIVGPGDRLPAGTVQSIEPDAVILAGPDGRLRRVEIVRPGIGARTP
jgi:hypothetical protein